MRKEIPEQSFVGKKNCREESTKSTGARRKKKQGEDNLQYLGPRNTRSKTRKEKRGQNNELARRE